MEQSQLLTRRDFLKAAMASSGGALLVACAPKPAPTKEAQPEAPMAKPVATPVPSGPQGEPQAVGGDATGVTYTMKSSLFDGQPIKLVIWDWHTPCVRYWEQKIVDYQKMYPNVSFELVTIPFGDYWTKATAALPAGQGPDIYHFHNSHHTPFIDNNLIEPFPEEVFEPNFLRKNWMGFQEGHFHDENGRIRYIPYGSMAAMMYFNKGMWEEAGLTEADYPATWDDLLIVGKKLTKYDSAGNIDVAGFAFNGYLELLWNDMNFQLGRYMYTKDGKGCQVDTPEGRQSLETIIRFYDQKINSPEFLEFMEAFGTEKAASIWSWTWFSGWLRETYPDLDFFTTKMPSFTGKDLPSLGRQNYEVSFVIPPQQPLERRQVSWDFLHWLYSNDENLVDLALAHNVAPAYKKLFDHQRILADPTIAELSREIEFKVFPGEFPQTMNAAMTQYIGQNIIAGASIDQALKEAQQAMSQAMQEQDYWVVERTYVHDDAMIPNQP